MAEVAAGLPDYCVAVVSPYGAVVAAVIVTEATECIVATIADVIAATDVVIAAASVEASRCCCN